LRITFYFLDYRWRCSRLFRSFTSTAYAFSLSRKAQKYPVAYTQIELFSVVCRSSRKKGVEVKMNVIVFCTLAHGEKVDLSCILDSVIEF
jgi:hypothetical protein